MHEMYDEMYKCHCIKLFLNDCNELFKTAAVDIMLCSFCSSHHEYLYYMHKHIFFNEDGAVM